MLSITTIPNKLENNTTFIERKKGGTSRGHGTAARVWSKWAKNGSYKTKSWPFLANKATEFQPKLF